MSHDFPARKGLLGAVAALIAISATVAGCSGHSSGSGSTGSSAADQAMLSAWKSGSCPANGTNWGGFASGMPLPTAKAGTTVALLPGTVTRVLLCRFDLDTSTLTGSALLTDTPSVTRIRSDLNSGTAVANSACIDRKSVV